MAEKVLAAVRTAPSRTEIREYPMPDIPPDAALMRVDPECRDDPIVLLRDRE